MKKLISFVLALAIIMICFNTTTFAIEKETTNKILIIYFSATGTTKKVAQNIKSILNCDIWEIVPKVPYTNEDLNYNNSNCRANLEQNDADARPEISGSIDNINDYDAVFLGYPIWWGKAPKIIYTFLETYNLSGKTIVPFCTSGGSGISTSVQEIKNLQKNAVVDDGKRLNGSTEANIREWISTLNLPQASQSNLPDLKLENNKVVVSNAPNDSVLIMTFYKSNKMIDLVTEKISGTKEFNLPTASQSADMFKAFLWDKTTIKPLCSPMMLDSIKNEQLINISSDEYSIIYKLNDSKAAKDLYAQLPITTKIEPYSNNEMIFYLASKLDTADAPLSNGNAGSLSYYSPWGDVVLFYDTFDKNNSLFELGTVVSGIENIEKMSGEITISVK